MPGSGRELWRFRTRPHHTFELAAEVWLAKLDAQVAEGVRRATTADTYRGLGPAERFDQRADVLDESVQHYASCRWMRCTSAAPQPRTTTGRQDTNAVISQGARSTPAAVSRW